jgi:DNA-binding XRE family transcriptional regulator
MGGAPEFRDRHWAQSWPEDDAEDRDHPLVMHYEIDSNWLDPVRHLLPSGRRRHDRAQAQLLAAAIDKARSWNHWISYSRRRAYYARRGTRYDAQPDLCTYDLIVPNLDLLTDVGLLQNEIAAADPTSGRQSTFCAAPALMEMLSDTPRPAARRKPRGLIQLRDQNRQLIDYRDTDDTTRMLRHLLAVNEMLESITLELPADLGERRGDLLIIDRATANLGNNMLHRVFNRDFKNGGRFYGHFVQGLPKKIRPLITVNGEPVAEPDYRAHHLRILYALEGQPLRGDPYEVDGWERSVAKVALLIMINAPSWQITRGAIMHRFGLIPDEAGNLIEALKHRHAPIAKYFQSGAGCRLQCYDSRMADRILVGATRQGIPVLPIHDSFITPARHEDRVRGLMDTAFQTVIFGSRGAPAIASRKQSLSRKPFHRISEARSLSLTSLAPPSLHSPPNPYPLPLRAKLPFFGGDRRLTSSGRIAVIDARRRRAIAQGKLAALVGISRPTLANILARRFGASPRTAKRIAEVIELTPAFERQPFLPGLVA